MYDVNYERVGARGELTMSVGARGELMSIIISSLVTGGS